MSKKERNKQRIFTYLQKYIHENGYSPSVREIAKAVGFKSTSTIHNYLNLLQEDGWITYADGKRRAISLNEDKFNQEQLDHNEYETEENNEEAESGVSLPLVGLITAGQPILADQNIEYNILLDNKLFTRADEDSYILRVSGDSMINAGIFDGDLLIVKPTQQVDRNEIIVALIGDEVTVKRFSYLDDQPYLFPENEIYEPIPFNTEDCSIIAKVVGLIRPRI